MTDLGLGDDDDAMLEEMLGGAEAPAPQTPEALPTFDDDDDDLDAFLADAGIETKEDEHDLTKPWMRAIGLDRFHLVTSEDEYDTIVDRIIELGEGALDLETEGFDNRIDYDDEGRPYTKHAIVGVCLGCEGHGYYIPLRHKFQATYGEKDPNLDSRRVEAGLKKLCQAAQPRVTEEGLAEDPLGSHKLDKTYRHIKLFFWNAKFDQEYLFPVVDIDFWHPDSFEDGMLAAYVIYSDDALGLKEHSSRRLHVKQGEEFLPCEMIEFKDLFPKGTPKRDMRFYDLYPEVSADGKPNKVVLYGCSDGLCTWMLCTAKENLPESVTRVTTPEELTMPEKDRQPGHFVELARKGKRYMFTYRLELQAVQGVRTIERTRAQVNVEEIQKVKEEADAEKKEYLEKIQAVAETRGFKEFNPGSTEQLSEFLFASKGLDINPKPEKTDGGQFKTDSDTLEKLHEKLGDGAPDILLWVIKYRQIEKQVGTYLTGMLSSVDENGCLRLNFRQEGAATGRFTAPKGKEGHGYAQIPIQGIPSKHDPKRPACANSLRRVFIARTGYVLSKVDYAGQELRVVANISGEDLWINEFLEGDGDLHTLTAQAFFPGLTKESPDFKEKRKAGKIANFALIYGGGVQAVMRATKCDQNEAARKLQAFHKSVPKFASWVKGQHALVKKERGVVTGFRRWIAIPDANTKAGDEYIVKGEVKKRDFKEAKKIVAACERKSTNYPIQGSGADILKISLVRLQKELYRRGWLKTGGDDSVRMVMTVHDEIVFEIRKDRVQDAMPVIIQCMESPSNIPRPKWRVPLIVEPLIGLNWEQGKPDGSDDWLKIISGEKPVPDYLQGYITPGKEAPPLPPLPEPKAAPPTQASPSLPPQTSSKSQISATLPPPPKGQQVAVFKLAYAGMTWESQGLVYNAITNSNPYSVSRGRDTEGPLLHLVNCQDKTLIGPELAFMVDPDTFKAEMKRLNFPCEYELTVVN